MKVIGAYSPFVQSACAVLFKSLVFFSTSCQRGDRHSLLGKDMNVDELITTVFFTILTSKFLPSLHFSSLLLSHDRSQSDADRHTETPCQAITADLWTQQWKHCWKPTRSEWQRGNNTMLGHRPWGGAVFFQLYTEHYSCTNTHIT